MPSSPGFLTSRARGGYCWWLSAEDTSAASELLTDTARLRKELLGRGMNPAGTVQRLELLLRVPPQGMDTRHYQVIASRAVRSSPGL